MADSKSNSSLDDLDLQLFQEAMQGVEPIRPTMRQTTTTASVQNRHLTAQIPKADKHPDYLSDEVHHPIAPNDIIEFLRPGLQVQQFKKLKAGHLAWQAALDLHGHTLAEARTSLTRFLSHCQHKQLRCVRVIHGKGLHPTDNHITIKSAVANWLKQIPGVMSYASCLPKDGGAGAVYVLLKRLKELPEND